MMSRTAELILAARTSRCEKRVVDAGFCHAHLTGHFQDRERGGSQVLPAVQLFNFGVTILLESGIHQPTFVCS